MPVAAELAGQVEEYPTSRLIITSCRRRDCGADLAPQPTFGHSHTNPPPTASTLQSRHTRNQLNPTPPIPMIEPPADSAGVGVYDVYCEGNLTPGEFGRFCAPAK